ncbi:uncharacterized protein CMU_011560 [Cryptosporidium muris RN66]|uniref:Uncharacterized protein n=1 Tax=Cryptosporidium muris (strain RN66) TaxID=441375 RepID=B6AJ15_CRYMR|nr:uncharacterized protein CMU_011560 [Cryptosporidium muris RN66]EEA08206.1 hypothetical protein, conserved [Cryptosporidium muris RN66]|eukprot:XP_002142555.1 hypothetical protein [Cryptosporidium muris RN66]
MSEQEGIAVGNEQPVSMGPTMGSQMSMPQMSQGQGLQSGLSYGAGAPNMMYPTTTIAGNGYYYPQASIGSIPMSYASMGGMPGMYEVDPNAINNMYATPYGTAMGSSFYMPNQVSGNVMTMPFTYDPYGLINPGIIPPITHQKHAKKKRSGCC